MFTTLYNVRHPCFVKLDSAHVLGDRSCQRPGPITITGIQSTFPWSDALAVQQISSCFRGSFHQNSLSDICRWPAGRTAVPTNPGRGGPWMEVSSAPRPPWASRHQRAPAEPPSQQKEGILSLARLRRCGPTRRRGNGGNSRSPAEGGAIGGDRGGRRRHGRRKAAPDV
ncbi:hypothetical protein GQ55_5G532300 [Panicum hallii var. hallii]|uniref:Uncharacterized protein n=1 Tax=Panicum hallii var. hallii TaxID=1504633 RepID=A0A2T7DT32_9POAL|nr:hypothetical protein GQ55_5G532300 [Panicum hallii var. hallii]